MILALIFSTSGLHAGDGNETRTVKYRVTAVSAADESITSESNSAEVPFPLQIAVPNAFTPNDDGINDQFRVVTGGAERFNLEIYNRWGAMIFATSNPSDWWDGTFEGSVVQDGVYVYQLSLLTYNKENVYRTGHVSVIK